MADAQRSCSGCHKTEPEVTLRRCSRCQEVWYCSTDCQRADFKLHKSWCKTTAGVKAAGGAQLVQSAFLVQRQKTYDELYEDALKTLYGRDGAAYILASNSHQEYEYDENDPATNPFHPDFTDFSNINRLSGIINDHDNIEFADVNNDYHRTGAIGSHQRTRRSVYEEQTFDEPYYEYPDPGPVTPNKELLHFQMYAEVRRRSNIYLREFMEYRASLGKAKEAHKTNTTTGAHGNKSDAKTQKPYSRLYKRTWLHDRPRQQTYELLIDSYRIFELYSYTTYNEAPPFSYYADVSTDIAGFHYYLVLAEKRLNLLPPWWNLNTRRSCFEIVTDKSPESLFSLYEPGKRSEILGRYEDGFETELLMFAEQVYNFGPGDEDNMLRLRELALKENDGKEPNEY